MTHDDYGSSGTGEGEVFILNSCLKRRVGGRLKEGVERQKELHWRSSGMAVMSTFALGFLDFSFIAITDLEHRLLWIGSC